MLTCLLTVQGTAAGTRRSLSTLLSASSEEPSQEGSPLRGGHRRTTSILVPTPSEELTLEA